MKSVARMIDEIIDRRQDDSQIITGYFVLLKLWI